MPPVVEHPAEEEQEMLMIAADRRRRVARAKLRHRAYLVGLAALVGVTTGLAVINVDLARQANAVVKPAVTAVMPDPPVTIDTAMLEATPPAPPAIAPKPEPEPIVEKSALPPLPKPRAVVKPPAPAPRAQTPPKPPVVAAPKAPAFIDAKSDPAIVRSPAATSPPPASPKVIQLREPAPPMIQRPPERPREVESSQSSDSTSRVAHWMAETYGRRDAQLRAELALTLYPEGDARTEHWRKVLSHLRATN